MKTRIFVVLIALFTVCFTGFSQNTIKGKVVDKKGNPVVGTRITLNNGTIATTDFDGCFEIEAVTGEKAVANCVGMQEKKFKMKDDMVIKLTKTNGWNRKPTKYSPFVMLQGGKLVDEQGAAVGVMAGMVKKIGWYAKFMVSIDDISGKNGYDVDVTSDRGINIGNYWTTGNYTVGYRQFTAGGVIRLGCPLHLCLGAGVCDICKYAYLVPDASGKVSRIKATRNVYTTLDCSLMLAFKHFTMNLSATGNVGSKTAMASIGFGYKF